MRVLQGSGALTTVSTPSSQAAAGQWCCRAVVMQGSGVLSTVSSPSSQAVFIIWD